MDLTKIQVSRVHEDWLHIGQKLTTQILSQRQLAYVTAIHYVMSYLSDIDCY